MSDAHGIAKTQQLSVERDPTSLDGQRKTEAFEEQVRLYSIPEGYVLCECGCGNVLNKDPDLVPLISNEALIVPDSTDVALLIWQNKVQHLHGRAPYWRAHIDLDLNHYDAYIRISGLMVNEFVKRRVEEILITSPNFDHRVPTLKAPLQRFLHHAKPKQTSGTTWFEADIGIFIDHRVENLL